MAAYYRDKVNNNGSADTHALLNKLKELFEQSKSEDSVLAPPAPLQLTHKHLENPKEVLESSDASLKLRELSADEVRQTLVSNLSMMVNQTSPAQVAQK